MTRPLLKQARVTNLGELAALRKGVNDDVTIQDVSSTNVSVTLDQLVHTSFLIRDAEQAYSFKDLIQTYLQPAMLGQARLLDRVVLGQYPQFLSNARGKLRQLVGSGSSATAKDYILDTRQRMNENKAYMAGRNLIWTPKSETELLKLDIFTSAERVGDGGFTLREAEIGRKLGFNHYMGQNMSSITVSGVDKTTGAVNNAAGYAKGTTTLVVDGITGALANGQWIDIAGDPFRIVSHTETTGNTTGITIGSPGLRYSVVDNDVITIYDPGAVNFGAGYAVGYSKYIVIDGVTNFPQTGQMVSFGTSATNPVYTIVDADSVNSKILLDRPLEGALADNDVVNIGPYGDFNLAFHRNAMTLVVRPLPQASVGARSAVVSYNGLSMRATITYDGRAQGHLVTLDMLYGIKVLDSALGAVLLG